MFLLVSLISAASAVSYTCGAWKPTSTGVDYTATGTVSVFDNSTGSYFQLTGASLLKGGVLTTNAVVAHLHASDCATMDAGPHFKKDVTLNATVLANELWASPAADANPAVQPTTGTWSGTGSLAGFMITGRTDVKAIILHEYPDAAGTPPAPKRVCCDLSVATAATTPAATTDATTAATGTTAAGTTAAGTTTAGTTAAAAVETCTTDKCCEDLGTGDRPCTTCFSKKGCQFFATLSQNIAVFGGACKLGPNATSTVLQKEIKTAAECVDTCNKLSCGNCIGDKGTAGCFWCDSGAAAGDVVGTKLLGTGSCEKSCKLDAAKRTVCSASSVLFSAAALAVSAVFMF